MSFRKNSAQQMSIFDSTFGLTEREQKALDRSWAKIFSEDVFPQIDEERFSVLYSDKASRPNTPVNVIVGALIIKELFAIQNKISQGLEERQNKAISKEPDTDNDEYYSIMEYMQRRGRNRKMR